jgi:hypothetical protein
VRDRLVVAAHGTQVGGAIPVMDDCGIRVQLESTTIAFVGPGPVAIVEGRDGRQCGMCLGVCGVELKRPVRRLL